MSLNIYFVVVYIHVDKCKKIGWGPYRNLIENVILCSWIPHNLISRRLLNYLVRKYFRFEHTWWRLFQKRVVRTIFVCVVRSLTALFCCGVKCLFLLVDDHTYSYVSLKNNFYISCIICKYSWINIIQRCQNSRKPNHLVIIDIYLLILSVPDEIYSRNASCTLNMISTFLFERTWWRLSQKHIVYTKYDIYIYVVFNTRHCTI